MFVVWVRSKETLILEGMGFDIGSAGAVLGGYIGYVIWAAFQPYVQ